LHCGHAHSLPLASASAPPATDGPPKKLHVPNKFFLVREVDGSRVAEVYRKLNAKVDGVVQEGFPVVQREHAAGIAHPNGDGLVDPEPEVGAEGPLRSRGKVGRGEFSSVLSGEGLDRKLDENRDTGGELRKNNLGGVVRLGGEMLLVGGRATKAFDRPEDIQVPIGMKIRGSKAKAGPATYSDCWGVCTETRMISQLSRMGAGLETYERHSFCRCFKYAKI
jgi:hypothetical protein